MSKKTLEIIKRTIKENEDKPNLRLVKTHTHGSHSAKVYKDKDWGEYRVKFYKNGQYQKKADSHHDDSEDAHNTAQYQIKQWAGINEETLTEDHRKAAAFAINHFGSGGHPEATEKNLHLYGTEYVHKTVKKAVADNRTSSDFKKIGNEILKDKMSFLKEDTGAGVKSDRVFASSNGHVNQQLMSSGVQYHATKYGKGKNKTKYHGSLSAAKKWVNKEITKKLDEATLGGEKYKGKSNPNPARKPNELFAAHMNHEDDRDFTGYHKDKQHKKASKAASNLHTKWTIGRLKKLKGKILGEAELDEATLGGEKYKGKSNPNIRNDSLHYDVKDRFHFNAMSAHHSDEVASVAGYRPGGVNAALKSRKQLKKHSKAANAAAILFNASKKKKKD